MGFPDAAATPATGANAEISELHIAMGVEEDVASLDVTVDVPLSVEVVEGFEHLLDDGGDDRFVEPVREGVAHDVVNAAPGQEGHDEPELCPAEEGTMARDHVRMIQLRHGLRFLHHLVLRPRPGWRVFSSLIASACSWQ